MAKIDPETINQLLPQSQCRACGYANCLSYATALAAGQEKAVNLCEPGGEEVMSDIAQLLDYQPLPVNTRPLYPVYIDENQCIGCKACILVCPVDAIVGSTKKMHSVLTSECTGCLLCLKACPVDCIHKVEIQSDYLPQARFLAHTKALSPRQQAACHARIRFENRNARLMRLKQRPQQRKTSASVAQLLSQASTKAANRKSKRITTTNQQLTKEKLLAEQMRAAYRKAQKNLRYGSAEQKKAALDFIQNYKTSH